MAPAYFYRLWLHAGRTGWSPERLADFSRSWFDAYVRQDEAAARRYWAMRAEVNGMRASGAGWPANTPPKVPVTPFAE